MPASPQRYLFSLSALLIILSLVLTGCTAGGGTSKSGLPLAALEGMPAEVLAAPESVQTAYQFALANPEITQHIPCYCGCGSMGHTSNYSCYVSSEGEDQQIAYDLHATGCSICVDITLDAMRLGNQGKAVSEIRSYIDGQYARYGPSNMP